MSESAPLVLLRQVFAGDIVAVLTDTEERADVRTAMHGDVRLIADAQGCTARVGSGDSRHGAGMVDALRAAIAARADYACAAIQRLEREVATLNNLRVPDCE